MVVPPLKIDILRRIIECALEGCVIANDEPATQLEQQSCLANLTLVSETFKDICTPQLYKDCLVSDVNHFLYGPEGNPTSEKPRNLSQVKTLRVYHSKSRAGATYFDIMLKKARWEDVGCTREMIPGIASEWADISAFDYLQNEIAAHRFQQGPRLRPGIFGSIERVCMTTTGDQTWGKHPRHHIIDGYSQFAWLPSVLLALPSVKHYCQSSMLGPLAIANCLYKPTNPPRTATFDYPHPYGFWDLNKLPPIVLGSINRYMTPQCTTLHSVSDDDEIRMTGGFRFAFEPLIEMLESFKPVNVQKGDQIAGQHIDTSMTANTVVEVYNYVKLSTNTAAPTSDLSTLQNALNRIAGPSWEGRVFLKNKEDCPPCSACGFKYT